MSKIIPLPPEDDYSFWNQQEKLWQESLPKLTEKELYDVFLVDSPDIVVNKLEELQQDHDELEAKILSSIGLIKAKPSVDERLVLQAVLEQTGIKQILALEKEQKRFKQYQQFRKGISAKAPLEVDLARTFPIERLVAPFMSMKRAGRNLVGICPFHTEKTPSFFLYPASNRFYCYGCKAGGDVIYLCRILNRFTFPEAIRYLITSL